ncbi:MAG: PilZ domain-containing protein [Thermodesulfobacteriota bacterium]
MENEERRLHKRHRPFDGALAINHHTLGPIVDISKGGLSFRYLEEESLRQALLGHLGIFLSSNDFLIDHIESKVVRDTLVANTSSFLSTHTRQCSIQFLNLTHHQTEQLGYFLQNMTNEQS